MTALAAPSMFDATAERRGVSRGTASQEFAGLMTGVAAGEVIAGIYLLATEGPVESALHAYEASTGRAPRAKGVWLEHLRVSPLPGGGMASFGVTF
jgi:hypothetical protein